MPALPWPSAGSRSDPSHSTTLPVCPLAAAKNLLLLLQAEESDLDSFKESDVKVLSSHQLIEFLSLLLQEVNHPASDWSVVSNWSTCLIAWTLTGPFDW